MFSKCNQAIDIIIGNIWMVVNELAELRLETSMKESGSVLVVEVIQMGVDFDE
jgi:hypothetical protein